MRTEIVADRIVVATARSRDDAAGYSVVVRVRVPVIMTNQVRPIVVSRVHIGRPPIAVVTVKRARTTGWRSRVTGTGTPLPNRTPPTGSPGLCDGFPPARPAAVPRPSVTWSRRAVPRPGASVRQTIPKPRPAADAIRRAEVRPRSADAVGLCGLTSRGRRLAVLLVRVRLTVLVQPPNQAPSSRRRTVRLPLSSLQSYPVAASKVVLLSRLRRPVWTVPGPSTSPARQTLPSCSPSTFVSARPSAARAIPGSSDDSPDDARRTLRVGADRIGRFRRSCRLGGRNSALLAAACPQSSGTTGEPANSRASPPPPTEWNSRSALDLRFSTGLERAWNPWKAGSTATASRVVGWPCDPPWIAGWSCFARKPRTRIARSSDSALHRADPAADAARSIRVELPPRDDEKDLSLEELRLWGLIVAAYEARLGAGVATDGRDGLERKRPDSRTEGLGRLGLMDGLDG